ncbi:hypothetical protein AcW1_005032 [Taiwanofungus camphoratus]|nr:hypothetical protein AcW2_005959 [Antrodia cinnamomea]KAI0960548.1 hypothetical protein AcW1_005032 [Antrodia cinnamomea]
MTSSFETLKGDLVHDCRKPIPEGLALELHVTPAHSPEFGGDLFGSSINDTIIFINITSVKEPVHPGAQFGYVLAGVVSQPPHGFHVILKRAGNTPGRYTCRHEPPRPLHQLDVIFGGNNDETFTVLLSA